MEFKETLEQATFIAEEASKVALSYFRHTLLIEMKANQTPVTIADKKTEEFIREALMQAFPEHGILGEEFGEEVRSSEYMWTIDPIDGTRSFIRGIPLFGTLLALLRKGEPVVGVMVLPALKETYTSALGLGTYCNGTQIRVSATQTLETAIVSCGDIPTFESARKTELLQGLMKRAELCRGYTDCFGHGLVARGAVDAMIDPIVSLWDIAALACIIREAGGEYCNFEGTQDLNSSSFMSFTPQLKAQLMGLVSPTE